MDEIFKNKGLNKMNKPELINILKNKLCYYDAESPDFVSTLENYSDCPEKLAEKQAKSQAGNCCCDTCFYGRHELARVVLDYLKIN